MNRKNVLFIIQNASFPFDRRVSKEALSLKQNGYNVYVVCPSSIYDPEKRGVWEGINIYRYKNYLSKGSYWGFVNEYLVSLIKIFFYCICLILVKKVSVVHVANPPDFFWPLAILCRIIGVKFISDQHDLSPEMFKIRFGNSFIFNFLLWNEKMTVFFANAIIVVNDSFKKRLEEKWNLENKSCIVVFNGPKKDFKPTKNNQLTEEYKGKKIILYVGLMTITDNVEVIIDVAKEIIHKHNRKECCFILLGDGDIRKKLEEEVAKFNLTDYVKFTGMVDEKKVIEHLYISDVCVAPDRPNGLNEYLTLIKIFEYMQAKKAFVSFDLYETKNVAKNSGLYATDIDDYAKKVLYLIENKNIAENMGEKGYELVKNNYCWEHSEKKLLALYNELV